MSSGEVFTLPSLPSALDPAQILADDPDSKEGKAKAKQSALQDKEVKQQMKVMDKAMAAGAVKQSKEEIAKSQTVILTLTRYGASTRFGKYLEDNGFSLKASELRKMSLEELEELEQRVKLCVANKSEDSLFTTGILFGINTVEQITQRPGVKERVDLAGWTQYLQNDGGFLDALEEIRISNSLVTALSPEKRLTLTLASSAFTVHNVNKSARILREHMALSPAPAPEPVVVEEKPAEKPAVSVVIEEPVAVIQAVDKVLPLACAAVEEVKEPVAGSGLVKKAKPGRKRVHDYSVLEK